MIPILISSFSSWFSQILKMSDAFVFKGAPVARGPIQTIPVFDFACADKDYFEKKKFNQTFCGI